MNLADLVRSLLCISPAELVDDDSAARVIIAVRWPRGPRCAECGRLAELNANALVCADPRCGAHFSIFVGTPLASLRRPSPRALLLALCAMASDRRGISARALARSVGLPHVTIWRHLHRLRELLPGNMAETSPSACVQVCGRRDQQAQPAGTQITRCPQGFAYSYGLGETESPPIRIVGESVRTWLNGTFHGVTARYLPWYLWEATARATRSPAEVLSSALAPLLAPAAREA